MIRFVSLPKVKGPDPLSPQQVEYHKGVFRGHYSEGEKKYATAGPCYLSKAEAGKHALPKDDLLDARIREASRYAVNVEKGTGTIVPNIGFAVHISYNENREPVVRVYPYELNHANGNPAQRGFLDPRIEREVNRICSEIAQQGVTKSVHGRPLQVAPREIVGETTVLDFLGRKPAQWHNPRDEASPLKEISFTYRR